MTPTTVITTPAGVPIETKSPTEKIVPAKPVVETKSTDVPLEKTEVKGEVPKPLLKGRTSPPPRKHHKNARKPSFVPLPPLSNMTIVYSVFAMVMVLWVFLTLISPSGEIDEVIQHKESIIQTVYKEAKKAAAQNKRQFFIPKYSLGIGVKETIVRLEDAIRTIEGEGFDAKLSCSDKLENICACNQQGILVSYYAN